MVFHHSGKDISCVAHGDEFTFCGGQKELMWIIEKMMSWFEGKVKATLGGVAGDDKHVIILWWHVRWTDKGIE